MYDFIQLPDKLGIDLAFDRACLGAYINQLLASSLLGFAPPVPLRGERSVSVTMSYGGGSNFKWAPAWKTASASSSSSAAGLDGYSKLVVQLGTICWKALLSERMKR